MRFVSRNCGTPEKKYLKEADLKSYNEAITNKVNVTIEKLSEEFSSGPTNQVMWIDAVIITFRLAREFAGNPTTRLESSPGPGMKN